MAAFGRDTDILGGRYDLNIWDDLVNRRMLRNPDTMRELREWYEDESETRLEPGGLVLLVGQRMSADDIYRHALDMQVPTGEDPDGNPTDYQPKYEHWVYQAHYDECCDGTHHRNMDPYDPAHPKKGACLLDPRRLPWPDCLKAKENPRKWNVLYQQADVSPDDVLVPHVWITGGELDGEVFPGCQDMDRSIGQYPKDLAKPYLHVATVDPSPTKMWACQSHLIQPDGYDVLINLFSGSMGSNDLLDEPSENNFTGLMEDWQQSSKQAGEPIGVWVVEQNAAQRFLLQGAMIRRWMTKHSVRVIGHNTHAFNKLDPALGIEGLLPGPFRAGRIRIPWGKATRPTVQRFVFEMTNWPHAHTDDQVMALWFARFNYPHHMPRASEPPRLNRPTWLRSIA